MPLSPAYATALLILHSAICHFHYGYAFIIVAMPADVGFLLPLLRCRAMIAALRAMPRHAASP